VETGNTPTFFLTWWFRTSNSEPPQLASCDLDLSNTPPRQHLTDAHGHEQDLEDAGQSAAEHKSHSDEEDAEREPAEHVSDAHGHEHDHEAAGQSAAEHKSHTDEADADRAKASIPPVDYQMFYPLSSDPFNIQTCAWAVNTHRQDTIPANTAMDDVPEDLRFKILMVVKDKDLVLRNATVTDNVVPTGRKVVHINCFAHAMMHLDKSAPGSLDERDSLGFAMKWLQRIDAGNNALELCCLWPMV
jgi:hypothetical protein